MESGCKKDLLPQLGILDLDHPHEGSSDVGYDISMFPFRKLS